MNEGGFTIFVFLSLIGGVFAFVVMAVLMLAENRIMYLEYEIKFAQLETARKGAEVRALQAQIDPHFLYNTLSSLTALMRLKRSDAAIACLYALSRFLRYKYQAGIVVTLEQELSYVKNYLIIQSYRYSDKLTTIFEVDETTLETEIPAFTLQPLVENACQHAVEQTSNLVELRVRCRTEGNAVVISIIDNGPGVDSEVIDAFEKSKQKSDFWPRQNVGMLNVHRRLQMHFGSNYGLNFNEHEVNGTCVDCRIPFRGE